MAVRCLSAKEFTDEVLKSKELVLVDFWAPWCVPCIAVASLLDKLSKEYKQKVKFCKINIDKQQAIAGKYQILSIPTILFFKGGKVVNQLVGSRSAADVKKLINSLL